MHPPKQVQPSPRAPQNVPLRRKRWHCATRKPNNTGRSTHEKKCGPGFRVKHAAIALRGGRPSLPTAIRRPDVIFVRLQWRIRYGRIIRPFRVFQTKNDEFIHYDATRADRRLGAQIRSWPTCAGRYCFMPVLKCGIDGRTFVLMRTGLGAWFYA
jgi:hypothetical protein